MPAPQVRAYVRYSSTLGLITCPLLQSETSLSRDSQAGRSLGHGPPLITKSFSFCFNAGTQIKPEKASYNSVSVKEPKCNFSKTLSPCLLLISAKALYQDPDESFTNYYMSRLVVPPMCSKSEMSSVAATEKRTRFNTLEWSQVMLPRTCRSLMFDSG